MKRPLWIRGVGSANFSASPSAIALTSNGMKSSRSRSRSLRETVSRTGLWTDSPIGNRSGARVHPAPAGVRNNGRADHGPLARGPTRGRPLPDLKQARTPSLKPARRRAAAETTRSTAKADARNTRRQLIHGTFSHEQRSFDAGRGARCVKLRCGRRTLGRHVIARLLAIASRRISDRSRCAATDTGPCSPVRRRPIPARVRRVPPGWRA
jgi:hypothetical protein